MGQCYIVCEGCNANEKQWNQQKQGESTKCSSFFLPNNPTLHLNESWTVLRQYQRLVFIEPPINEHKAALRNSSFSLRGRTNLIQMRGLRSPTSSCFNTDWRLFVSRKKYLLRKEPCTVVTQSEGK
ncbi:unnamed protein product [Arctogadus glacialis]